MQRCRDRQWCRRPRHGVMVACFADDTALHHGLGQLLDKQRHAIGAINDLIRKFLGQRLAAGHARDHLDALPARQASEAEQSHVRTPDPWGNEFRPEGNDQQHP